MLEQKKLIKINTKTVLISMLIIIAAVFLLPTVAFAADIVGTEHITNDIALSSQDPRTLVARIINVFLSFLAIIAIGLVIYSGFIWMSSAGDPQKIDKAKKILKGAVIGLAIILSSWGIVLFIFNMWDEIVNPAGPTTPTGPPQPLPALGAGIMESHYPGRGQTGVPRNTKIAVTFKEPIDANTICQGGDGSCDPGDLLIPMNVRIFQNNAGDDCDVNPPNCPNNIWDVKVESNDNKTFVFTPNNWLGSISENIWHKVKLMDTIIKLDGNPAFSGAMGGLGYEWQFETSTNVDTIPPQVVAVSPTPLGTYARNIIVQLYFNEALNPISASGDTALGFDNIETRNVSGGGFLVSGLYLLTNQYTTVTFITDNACGTNSCGDTIYCLPGNATPIRVTIKADGLPPPPTGITDMAGNSLDGDQDGAAEGPGASDCNFDQVALCDAAGDGDNVYFEFNTNNNIDLTAPQITAISPASGAAGLNLTNVPSAVFNKTLNAMTLTTGNTACGAAADGNIILDTSPIRTCALNYWPDVDLVTVPGQTTVYVYHDIYNPNENYGIQFNTSIQDLYQNCFRPAASIDPGCTCTPTVANPYCCDCGPPQVAPCLP